MTDPRENVYCGTSPTSAHCFCVQSNFQHAVPRHMDMECCWCGKGKCVHLDERRVPGHGPGRTKIVVPKS